MHPPVVSTQPQKVSSTLAQRRHHGRDKATDCREGWQDGESKDGDISIQATVSKAERESEGDTERPYASVPLGWSVVEA